MNGARELSSNMSRRTNELSNSRVHRKHKWYWTLKQMQPLRSHLDELF